MMQVYVDGVGVWGPGLLGWNESEPILAGEKDYCFQSTPIPKPSLLAARERRRAGTTVLLAIEAAMQACAMSTLSADQYAGVFTAAAGDLEILDYMCAALADQADQADKHISPTKFHNSVHNAAGGYWAIGTQCHQPINCISGGQASFGIGLLEAIVQVIADNQPVLLVAFDIASPPPLNQAYAVDEMFATALALTPTKSSNHAVELSIDMVNDEKDLESTISNKDLNRLRCDNPSAQALPLLAALASKISKDIFLAVGINQLLKISI